MGVQLGFFDEANRLKKLSQLGDSLEKLNNAINREMFRPFLTKALAKEHKGAGGRPPYDVILMFKILVLQRIYNFSDDQTEYQINDRMSFLRFLGLSLRDRVPDAKTIWLFKNTLSKTETMKQLFDGFGHMLEENQIVKSGKIPEEWQNPKNTHKLAQKDTDARWTKKNNEVQYNANKSCL